MNAKTLAAALAVCAWFAAAPAAQAQFVGQPMKPVTVKSLLETGVNGQYAAVEGNIVAQMGHEKYTFRDATGEILVDVDDKVFAGQRVEPQTRVRLEGELERKAGRPDELDVDRLTVLTK